MREIKFRGKRIDNGEWVHGDLIHERYGTCIQYTTTINPKGYGAPERKAIIQRHKATVDPATVGQFTGLKDRNGVEIYEGDIVTFNNNNFKVVYKQDRYYIGWVATDEGENCYIHIWYDDIEVLGNIYDNPELLEGGPPDAD